MEIETAVLMDDATIAVVEASHNCPLCGGALVVLSAQVKCPQCGLMLCESCEGLHGA